MKLLSRLHETRVVRRLRAMFCAIFLLTVITPTGAQTTVLNGYAYKKITRTNELNATGEYVLVCEATNSVMTEVSNNRGQVGSCTLSDGVFTGYTTAPLMLTILKDGSNYNIQCSGGYLKLTNSSKDLSLSDSRTKIAISFDDQGNAKIGFDQGKKYIVLNGTQLIAYTTYDTDTYKAVQLYRRVYVVNFPTATQGLTTFYNADYRYEVPADMKVYAVTAAKEGQPISLTDLSRLGTTLRQAQRTCSKERPVPLFISLRKRT